jgi:hypothetical protein
MRSTPVAELPHGISPDARTDGDRGWSRWNNAYASMVEWRVEDQLPRMTPRLSGGSSAFSTEEDLQADVRLAALIGRNRRAEENNLPDSTPASGC